MASYGRTPGRPSHRPACLPYRIRRIPVTCADIPPTRPSPTAARDTQSGGRYAISCDAAWRQGISRCTRLAQASSDLVRPIEEAKGRCLVLSLVALDAD